MLKRAIMALILVSICFGNGWANYAGEKMTYANDSVRSQAAEELTLAGAGRVNLSLSILVLDDIDVDEKIDDDVKKAIDFVQNNSRFNLQYKIFRSNLPHGYTHYDCPEGKQACVVVNKEDVNQDVIKNLPVSTFYFLFWKANGTPVLQAGSSWGVAYGILKAGFQRPYSTASVDQWWYNRDPFEGFEYRSSQLISHELINLIQGLIEVEPYACGCAPLTSDNLGWAYDDEQSRLNKMTDDCYQKIKAINRDRALASFINTIFGNTVSN